MALAELVVSIVGDMSKLSQTFTEAASSAGNLGSKMSETGKSLSSAGGEMTAGITAPIVAVGAGIGATIAKASEFDTGMRRVATMLPGITQSSFNDISNQALTLSKDFGSSTGDMTNAMYQALSSGVPKENIFAFMQEAEKLAVGGASDVVSTTDVLTNAVNSYGQANLSTAQASDILFQGTKFGKSTVEELSHTLSNVMPIAASVGVGFDDVNASLATMTIQGTPTSEAVTQLRGMLDALSTPTDNAAQAFKYLSGQTFPEFINSGHNMGDAMQVLQDGVGKTIPESGKLAKVIKELNKPTSDLAIEFKNLTGMTIQQFEATGGDLIPVLDKMGVTYGKTTTRVSDYFGRIEAGTGALQLGAQGNKIYQDSLAGMGTAAGSTDEAFKTMSEGSGAALDRLKAAFEVLVIKIGQDFLPILSSTLVPAFGALVDILDKANPFIKIIADAFNALPMPVKLVALAFVAFVAALGPVLIIAGAVASGLGAVATLFGAGGALAGVGAVIGTVVAALGTLAAPILIIVGVLAVLYLAWTNNWGGIRDTISSIVGAVSGYLQTLYGYIVEYAGKLGFVVNDLVKGNWTAAWNDFVNVITNIGDKLKPIITDLWMMIQQTFSNGIMQVSAYVSGINWTEVGKKAMNTLIDGIVFVMGTLVTIFSTAFSLIYNFLFGINWYQLGVSIVTTLKDGFVLVVGALYIVITTAFSLIWGFLTGVNWYQLGVTILTTLENGIMSVLGALAGIVIGALTAISDRLSTTSWGAAGVSIWNSFVNGVSSVLNTAYTIITGAITTIIGYLSGLNLSSVGQLLWNTFILGLQIVVGVPYVLITGAIQLIQSFLNSVNFTATGSLIWNTFVNGINAVLNGAYTIISGAITAIQSFLNGINLSSIAQAIWNTFILGLKIVIGVPLIAIQTAVTAIQGFLSGINLTAIGTAIWNTFVAGVNAVIGLPLAAITTAITAIKSFLSTVNISAMGTAIWNTLLAGINAVLQGPYNAIVTAINTIKSFLTGTTLNSIAQGIWNTFLAGLNAVIQGPYNAILAAINTIKSFLTSTTLSSIASAIWNTFLAGINAVIQGPYNAILAAINTIKSFLSGINLSSIGSTIWNTFLAGVNAVISAPYNAIVAAINTIKSFLSGINLSSIGTSMINTLQSGVLSGISAMVSAATTALNNFKNSVTSALSGVLSTAQGYATQITNALSSAQSAAKTVAQVASSVSSAASTVVAAAAGTKVNKSGATATNQFAVGGIITKPLYALMGEAGPEAIIPLDKFPKIFGEIALGLLSGIKNPVTPGMSSGLRSGVSNVTNSNANYQGDNVQIGPIYPSNNIDIKQIFNEFETYQSNKKRARGYI